MKEGIKVAVIDGGGRGSVLAHKYSQSPQVTEIIAIPGNDLMQMNCPKPVTTFQDLRTTDVVAITQVCKERRVDLVDVAQEDAVAAGLADRLGEMGIPTVGPARDAGRLEWDKAFAREFMEQAGIPHPEFRVFSSPQEGIAYILEAPEQPRFIKANGLVMGKGALPARDNDEAIKCIKELERFGEAGRIFLIEQWLEGEEFSTFVICDGKSYKVAGSAQDHKRVNDFDEGENTGGMGAYTPALVLTPDIVAQVEQGVISATLVGLNARKTAYKGVLYVGGMVVVEAGKPQPFVIEYNSRWGDPEAQVVVPGIQNDLFEVGMAVHEGNLDQIHLQLSGSSRVAVAGAARGYPGDYSAVRGKRIYGLSEAGSIDGVTIYRAGVKEIEGVHYANGGRLFYVVGEGDSVITAREKAYAAMARIHIEGNNLHYRTDVGWRDAERLRPSAHA